MKTRTVQTLSASVMMTLACASAATADISHAGWSLVDNGIDDVLTVQCWVQFDDALDSIEAVYGNADTPLQFHLGAPTNALVNFGDNGGASSGDDDPGNHEYDSWVGFAGSNAAIAGQKTPDFWGVPFGGLLTGVLDDGIHGLWDDNSSYFIPGGLPVGALDNGNRVTIAQFSFAHPGHHGRVEFSGGIQYNQGEQYEFLIKFAVPAPGAFAIFGFAAVGRRRRQSQSSEGQ